MSTDFGREMSCTRSLKTGRFVTGPRLVAEAAYRRLTTPRGLLRGGEDEAAYGLNLLGLVGSVTTKGDAAALAGRIQSELSKDERITMVTANVLASTSGPSTTYQITIDAETSDGPFVLKLAASAVTVELLGIEAEG